MPPFGTRLDSGRTIEVWVHPVDREHTSRRRFWLKGDEMLFAVNLDPEADHPVELCVAFGVYGGHPRGGPKARPTRVYLRSKEALVEYMERNDPVRLGIDEYQVTGRNVRACVERSIEKSDGGELFDPNTARELMLHAGIELAALDKGPSLSW